MKTVWIVDDDESIAWVLQKNFEDLPLQIEVFSNAESAIDHLKDKTPDVVFTDVRMPNMDGYQFIDQLKQRHPAIPVIIMTAFSDIEAAVSSYQAGAFEYLPKPFDLDEALSLLNRALLESQTDEKHGVAYSESEAKIPPPQMIGRSAMMQEVFRLIGRVSHSSISVLIRGESGVGKELVARALHDSSPRKHKPFIEINTGAIPADLLESELFGHEKGAFTGATTQRKGRFEQANGGTLFLDEIGDMPSELQARLLRVLSEKRFYRVGGTMQLDVDVRVIAATNQDLDARVSKGLFRLDLYHRLNVVEIMVPPLRHRGADVALLGAHFLQSAALEFEVAAKALSKQALEILLAYNWPGNVRELENLCKRLTVTSLGQVIEAGDLPAIITQRQTNSLMPVSWQTALGQELHRQLLAGRSAIGAQFQSTVDRTLIETTLSFTEGHKQKAAKLLGWGRNTLTRKIKELNL